jgi:hypothetical protein
MLFLLPIAGIVIEGLITKSFFNTSFSDLSVLGGVGVLGGVQWPWTLSLIASHVFVSFIIPLTLAMFLMRDIRVSKVAAYGSAGILALFIGWTTVVTPHMFGGYWMKLGALVLIIALLVRLSRTVHINSSSAASAPLWIFFVAGLLFPVLNWLTSFFLAAKPLTTILVAQLIFMSAYLCFMGAQWFNERTTVYKHLAFIAGYYSPFAIGLILAGIRRDMADYRLVGACLAVGMVALLVAAVRRSERV